MEQKECGYRISNDQVDTTQFMQMSIILSCRRKDCELSIAGRIFLSSISGSNAEKRSEALLAAQAYRKVVCPLI